MARIDASIYQNQAVPQIFGAIQEGRETALKMSDLAKQREREAKNDKYMDWKRDQEQNSAKLEAMDRETKEAARIFGSVKDQSSLEAALGEWQKRGYSGIEKLPTAYDKGFYDNLVNRSLSYQDRLAQQYKDKEFDYKDRADKREEASLGLKRQELALQGQKIKGEAASKGGELATKLRQERTGLPVTKATQDVSAAFNKMQKAAAADSAAGDMSLIYGFMRMQDPGSTVREGEFATAQNAAGIPEQMRNAYNRAISGTRLGPDQRADFLGRANEMYNAQLDLQKQVDGTYERLAKDAGVDPSKVLINFEANKQVGSGMVQMQAPDGSIRSIPESQVQAALAAGGKLVGGMASGR